MYKRTLFLAVSMLLIAACVPDPHAQLVVEEHLLKTAPDLSTEQLVFQFATGDQKVILAKTASYKDFRQQYEAYNRQVLEAFGYLIKDQTEPSGAGYMSIYRGDQLVAKDVMYMAPISVNASQTNFIGLANLPNDVYSLTRDGLTVLPRPPGREVRGYVGDKLLYTEVSDAGQGVSRLQVYLGNESVYDTQFHNVSTYAAFDGPWTYGNHWALVLLDAKPDAAQGPEPYDRFILDGQDINSAKGYEQSFQFAVLDGRPFYFFQKNGKIGISFEGKEIAENYDEIPHYQCCTPALLNPGNSMNMVWFFARRGNHWYYVEAYIPR
jgi:hypothetical protein